MYILIQNPSTRVSCNQIVLSLQSQSAFYTSVAGFRIMMPCLTHYNTDLTFQHIAESGAMLVLFGKECLLLSMAANCPCSESDNYLIPIE